ncbi:hypothetical protein DEO72_LG7g1771 [Vigna unguiculata]|uniref:F-box domain-containing protein n=1 Tax=Vigna unguiculata TaxID=3917 RepID=A0A4D6MID2_VIGUN|nr:hypothetical protein DEO72_LG7g1771 [Vigna unguiculata]
MTNTKSNQSEPKEISCNETCKRQRMSAATAEECPRLIPNLPDELSIQIIARLPRVCYYNIRLVSRKWKATIMSSELYKVRKEIGTTEEWLYLLVRDMENKLLWHALDPRFHGKLHFIAKDSKRDIAVLQAVPCSNLDYSASASTSTPPSPKFMEDDELFIDSAAETDTVVWVEVANKSFGQAELINCQVIDI